MLLLLIVAAPLALPARAAGDVVVVTADQAKVIRLPDKVQTVVVGNPGIADVTVRGGLLIITGKSYGTTNVIALDALGNMLDESTVRVEGPRDSVVTVQRGTERESYSCTPSCQSTVAVGDNQGYFKQLSDQVSERNTLAGVR